MPDQRKTRYVVVSTGLSVSPRGAKERRGGDFLPLWQGKPVPKKQPLNLKGFLGPAKMAEGAAAGTADMPCAARAEGAGIFPARRAAVERAVFRAVGHGAAAGATQRG